MPCSATRDVCHWENGKRWVAIYFFFLLLRNYHLASSPSLTMFIALETMLLIRRTDPWCSKRVQSSISTLLNHSFVVSFITFLYIWFLKMLSDLFKNLASEVDLTTSNLIWIKISFCEAYNFTLKIMFLIPVEMSLFSSVLILQRLTITTTLHYNR